MKSKQTNSLLVLLVLAALFLCPVSGFSLESNVVTEFAVEGNQLIPADVILLNVKMKKGDVLDDETVQAEINRVGEMGYFSYVGAEVRPGESGKKLVFKVEENAIIGEVEVKGNTKVATEKILKAMESQVGSVFNSKLLSQDIQNVNELMAREGFLFTKVTDAAVKDRGSKIFVEVTEGILGEVKIEGLRRTKEKVVRRELTVKPGQIYDNNKIVRDLQRIYNLGFFEEVKRDHLPGKTPEEVVLVIQLVEQKTGRAGVGGGYSSLNGLVGFANLSQNNFRGMGQRVYLKTEFGGVQTYELGYFDPWFMDRPHSVGFNVYNTKYTRNLYNSGDTVSEYEEHRRGGDIVLGKRIRRDLDLSFRFRDEDVNITPTNPNDPKPVGIVNGRLQTFGGVLDKDTRDNRFRPTAGVHDTLSVETTGGFLRGENQYSKYALAMRRYFRISGKGKTVLALQGVTGRTMIGEGFVPVYDMYSVGGSNTVRGYREREFLGTKVLYGNMELRQNIAKNFDLVGFYDVGDAWGLDYNRQNKNFDTKAGYGFGLRLQTPLGPVAIDYGKATDRDDGRTYFNFGSSF
jgi:outer membrane protein insertion porin family